MEKEPTRREPERAGREPAGIAGKARRAAWVAGRRALAALLSAALAAALVPAPALAQDGGGAYVGEGSVALQASGVVVDGTAVSAAALAAALPSMQRVPAAAGGPMSEYAGIIAADAAAAGSLAQVGSRLSLVFLGASCSLLASGILSHGEPAAFVIPAGSVDGVDRDLYVVVASTSAVLVDGVPIGACWLQYDLLSYISGNYDSIKVAPSEAETAATAEAARDAFIDMAGRDLSRSGRDNVTMVSVGYNKVTGNVAIGVKLKENQGGKDAGLAVGQGTLSGGVPYLAVLDDGSTLVSGKKKNCAEDACVQLLGGLGETEAGNIVMLPPFNFGRLQGPASPMVTVRKVCEGCERAYGRHSFAPGTEFDSPTVVKE